MINFDTYEYNLGKCYATALLYGDTSGLEDDDIKLVYKFIDELVERHGQFHIEILDANETDFRRCELSGLYNDCWQYNIMVKA